MQKWSSGGLTIDFYDDIFLDIRENTGLMEKVGSMKVLTPEELNKLPDEKFGLVVLASPRKIRKYPLHDREHAILAKEFFEKNSHKLTTYMQKTAAYYIGRACTLFGVGEAGGLEKLSVPRSTNYVDSEMPEYAEPTPWRTISISTLPDSEFALIKTANGNTYRHFPIDTTVNLQTGVEVFNHDYKSYRPLERVKIASAMIQKAKKLGVEIDMSVLSKYATAKENPNFNLYMNMRKEILNDDLQSKEALTGLIEKKAEFKGQSFGRALEVFDETTGLDHMWDVAIPDPYESCYAINDDKIDAHGIIKTASRDERIMKLAESDKLSSVFSDSAAKEFKKNPVAIFNSLPTPTQQLLLSL